MCQSWQRHCPPAGHESFHLRSVLGGMSGNLIQGRVLRKSPRRRNGDSTLNMRSWSNDTTQALRAKDAEHAKVAELPGVGWLGLLISMPSSKSCSAHRDARNPICPSDTT